LSNIHLDIYSSTIKPSFQPALFYPYVEKQLQASTKKCHLEYKVTYIINSFPFYRIQVLLDQQCRFQSIVLILFTKTLKTNMKILQYLEKGIKISSSSFLSWIYHHSHISNLDNNYFASFDKENSWLDIKLFQFVQISKYYLRTSNRPTGDIHPKSWVLLGKTKTKDWVCIDEKRNVNETNSPSALNKYLCSVDTPVYRIRFMQTEPNHHGNNMFCFSYFEIKGLVFYGFSFFD